MDENMPLYPISVAARILGMHPQTLRLYERHGFVEPYRRGNQRLYSIRNIEQLKYIKELSDNGVSLSGIDLVLSLKKELEELNSRVSILESENKRFRERIKELLPPLPETYVKRTLDIYFFKMKYGSNSSEGDDKK
ncbi:MAG: MerR family transcriptional regulator [Thermotogae bacterium]|nr:MerR family transcriptional regulator [Thermotogota bacterium]